ncbi:MAG: hypothetical protein AAGH99_13200 [Planctomycetota bacterium]
MPNARKISQRINELLAPDGPSVSSAELAKLASDYSELSRRAHERLGRCHDLLAESLRSEAVQESDLEPSLLKQVAALEIKDFRAWHACCQEHKLPLPWPLSRYVAAELNRAYAADQLVAPLLQEYRFRCLARRPLAERIAALRGVAGLDKENHEWHESLILLETHRLSEIPAELEKARGNADALRALQRELLDDRRRVPVPASIQKAVDEALRDTLVRQAQHELRTLLPSLNEAYSAMDFRVAQRLLNSWDATLKSVGQSHLQLPDDMREPVQPIMDWVQTTSQQQQQEIVFRQECGRLRDLIDSPTDLNELDRAEQTVANFGMAIPDALAEDTRRARQRLMLDASRRRRNRLAAVAGLVAAAAVGVGFVINQQVNEKKVTSALAEVERGLREGNFDTANERMVVLASSYPSALSRTDVIEVKTDLDRALDDEEQRLDRYASLFSRLMDKPGGELTDEDVDELQSLARLAKEKTQAQELAGRREAWVLEQQRQREARALADIEDLRNQLNEIQPAHIDREPQAVLTVLNDLRSDIADLQAEGGWNSATSSALDAAARRERSVREALDFVLAQEAQAQQRSLSLEQVVAASGTAEGLSAALGRYATNHADDAGRAQSFEQARRDKQAWLAIEAWQQLNLDQRGPSDLTQVAMLLRDLDAYLSAYPRSPVRETVEAYRQRWAQALLVSSDSGPWLGRLPEVLRAPVIRDLNVIDTSEDRRYYVVGQGNRRETSLGTIIDVILTPDITQPETVKIPAGTASEVRASAQAKLAADLLARIADYELSAWPTFHLDLVEAVLDARDVDTVLRSVLVTMIIDEAESTLGRVHPDLAQFRKLLNAQNEDGLNWLNPDDIIAATVRGYQDRIIAERRPNFSEIKKTIAAATDAVTERFGWRLADAGVLLRENRVANVSGLPESLSERIDYDAYVAFAPGDSSAYRLREIGKIRGGRLSLSQTQAAGVPEGSMVFLFRTPEKTSLARR